MFPVRICIQLRSAAAAFEWHTAIPGLLWVPAWWLWSDPLQTSCCARPHAVVSIGKCQFEVFIIKCPKKIQNLVSRVHRVHHCSSLFIISLTFNEPEKGDLLNHWFLSEFPMFPMASWTSHRLSWKPEAFRAQSRAARSACVTCRSMAVKACDGVPRAVANTKVT